MNRGDVYLASASPRRAELLKQIGLSFKVVIADIDEAILAGETPKNYTARVTKLKAQTAFEMLTQKDLPIKPIIAADTAVFIDDCILGKPIDYHQAKHMLLKLSGRCHQVYTSVGVKIDQDYQCVTQISEVEFAKIQDKDIKDYWQTNEPKDKAGAYAIQGIGAKFVKGINGSYSGVMGLPLFELCQLLKRGSLCQENG